MRFDNDITLFNTTISSAMMRNFSDTNILTRVDDIKKPPEDKRNYRGVTLRNGLKVLLVSDQTTDKSAACLCGNFQVF